MRSLMACCHAAFAPPAAGLSQGLRSVSAWSRSPHGGAPFAGGYRLNTPFGYLLAPNITPDAQTGIGSWSADDFYRAMHEGVNRRGEYMYPAMPYDFYAMITREDSDALYAYLRSVKPVANAVAVNHLRFPFNQRL